METTTNFNGETQVLEKALVKLSPSEQRAEIARRKSPEEKLYVILIRSDLDEIDHTWLEATGRSEAYEIAKSLVTEGDISLKETIVLVEGNSLENSVSIYWFLKHMQQLFNDGFNVDDYDQEGISNNDTPDQKINPTPESGSTQIDVTYNPNAETGTDI